MNNYSPNALKTFETCPYKYCLKYKEKISVPQKISYFEKGKKIHALANYYLRGDNIEKLEKALISEERKIWETLKNNEYFQKTYVASEYDISCKIGDYWIGGRLDALVKDDENNFYILDYKTGLIPKNPEYDFQTMIYLLCLSKKYKTENVYFVYIGLKNNETSVIKLSNEKIKEYETKIISICEQIEKIKENAKHYKNCDFCEYRKICI